MDNLTTIKAGLYESINHSRKGRENVRRSFLVTALFKFILSIDFQKNNFAALSVGNGRKWPIPSLLPCEMNFLKVYI
jgi:hypothetical protein